MSFTELIVLLPCQSLEDLSLDHKANDAEAMLASWSALYHPVLIHSAESTPRWEQADNPPVVSEGSLITLSPPSKKVLPATWIEESTTAGARIIDGLLHRHEMVATALAELDTPHNSVGPELVADFLALGFCHLQVELLTRQLRYMSNLDEDQFQIHAVAAAKAAVEGDEKEARDELQRAFDLLTEAREYFYPVEAHLLDLTLVASTTLGKSLQQELKSRVPTNLLMSGELVARLAHEDKETTRQLQNGLKDGSVGLIGGDYGEGGPAALLPLEAILASVQQGLTAYREHLGQCPSIYGRRRYGLTPLLPGLLKQAGFSGLLHFTLDEGRFPKGIQSKILWEGPDATKIEALARLPIDAARTDLFLKLPEKLGDVMDLDHVATAVFAHWPGQACLWYEDIKRMDAYSPVLGRFISIDKYFEETELSGQVTRYACDQYRAPYLRQSVRAEQLDPISRWVRYYRRSTTIDAIRSLTRLAEWVAGPQRDTPQIGPLAREIFDCLESPHQNESEIEKRLAAQLDEAVAHFAERLPRSNDAAEEGTLVLNPWSFSRQMLVQPAQASQSSQSPETFANKEEERSSEKVLPAKLAVVDVPAMGFAWSGPESGQPSTPLASTAKKQPRRLFSRRKRGAPRENPPLAEENVLRNEFFQLKIDPYTGAIRSVHDYHTRDNRLAQQVALRLPRDQRQQEGGWGEDDSEKDYSLMAADEIRVTSTGPLVGELVCRGRLMNRQGERLARFIQTIRVQRASRIIELELELDTEREPSSNPWNSYYAMRFAWHDATLNVYRSVQQTSQPTDAVQLEAPHFIDLRGSKVRTTLLTGGLPYHRRFGLRKLDTLLMVQGERTRRFRMGIGIDLAHPFPASLEFMTPETVHRTSAAPLNRSGWLFHLNAKNVVATCWESIATEKHIEGFRVRLLETEGRATKFNLRCFRSLKSAYTISLSDPSQTKLPVEDDLVTVQIKGYEWLQLEGRWKS